MVMPDVRVHCCTALGVLYFVGEDNPVEILTLIKMLQQVLENSDIRCGKTGHLYAKVMNTWSLLLTLLAPKLIGEQISNGVLLSSKYLLGMLESTHLAVRTVTGKTLALMYELGLQHDPNYLHDKLPDLIVAIQKLATGAYRFQSQEDRKLQRSIFRDVLQYLQERVTSEISIKFADEILPLDSWVIHHQYTCLRDVFGSGMNVHVEKNGLVRDILKLGPKMDTVEKHLGKIVKKEQQLRNVISSKNRSIARGKERNKRFYTLE